MGEHVPPKNILQLDGNDSPNSSILFNGDECMTTVNDNNPDGEVSLVDNTSSTYLSISSNDDDISFALQSDHSDVESFDDYMQPVFKTMTHSEKEIAIDVLEQD